MTGTYEPAAEELHPWAYRQFEHAYDKRQRPQCDRGDFWSGYRAALISLKALSQFKERPRDIA